MSYQKGFGLRPKMHDGSEFSVGAVIQLRPLSEIPKGGFRIDIPESWVITQRYDTCAKEAGGNLLSYINKVRLDALYTWVIARANNNYRVEDWGVDIKSLLLACVKAGAPKWEDSPYHSDGDRNVFADIKNWDLPTIQPKAIVHKAGTAVFVEPTNGMDYFDTIRATVWTLKTPVVIGLTWNWDPQIPNITTPATEGYGHAMLVLGDKDDGVEVVEVTLNSWGLSVGDRGKYNLSRAVINRNVPIFGAGTLIDETPERVKWHIDNGVYLDDPNEAKKRLLAIYIAVLGAIRTLMGLLPKKTGVPPYPELIIALAEAIRRKEGFAAGTRAWRNNSPFNSRYVGQYKAIGEDRAGVPKNQPGYAIFPDLATGWAYCLKVLWQACTGQSVAYNAEAKKLGLASSAELSLYQYFAIFAPKSDSNDPKKYAEDVAMWVGTSPDAQLRDFTL